MEKLAAAEAAHRRNDIPDHHPRSLCSHSPRHTRFGSFRLRRQGENLGQFRRVYVSSHVPL